MKRGYTMTAQTDTDIVLMGCQKIFLKTLLKPLKFDKNVIFVFCFWMSIWCVLRSWACHVIFLIVVMDGFPKRIHDMTCNFYYIGTSCWGTLVWTSLDLDRTRIGKVKVSRPMLTGAVLISMSPLLKTLTKPTFHYPSQGFFSANLNFRN
jgi:hypothetical protein